MTKPPELIHKTLACPALAAGGIIGVSAAALGGAYYAEFALGLAPCILCLYQRIPYAAAIILAVVALFARKNRRVAAFFIFLCALSFLINAGIASYHVGVEEGWWVSAVEGCAVPGMDGDSESMLDSIMKAPAVSCTEVAWRDPVLGVSMAGYNALLSFILFFGCGLSALLIGKRA